jgi:MOSC domain-containing protein YiiM
MPEVAHLFLCFVHRFPMKEVEEAELIENKGLRGCIHGRPGNKRQVLLMDRETLGRFGLPPGVVKENITTQGIDFQTLGEGQRVRVGPGLLEITGPCDPCERMDEIRMGLQQELCGQRGWLCKVLESGRIRRGDRIEVLAAAEKAAL